MKFRKRNVVRTESSWGPTLYQISVHLILGYRFVAYVSFDSVRSGTMICSTIRTVRRILSSFPLLLFYSQYHLIQSLSYSRSNKLFSRKGNKFVLCERDVWSVISELPVGRGNHPGLNLIYRMPYKGHSLNTHESSFTRFSKQAKSKYAPSLSPSLLSVWRVCLHLCWDFFLCC